MQEYHILWDDHDIFQLARHHGGRLSISPIKKVFHHYINIKGKHEKFPRPLTPPGGCDSILERYEKPNSVMNAMSSPARRRQRGVAQAESRLRGRSG